jgi:hypothetical protein
MIHSKPAGINYPGALEALTMATEAAWFKQRKNAYRRSARVSKQMKCSLRLHDVQRALHYRSLERLAKQYGV